MSPVNHRKTEKGGGETDSEEERGGTETERDRQTDRQTDRDTHTETEKENSIDQMMELSNVICFEKN